MLGAECRMTIVRCTIIFLKIYKKYLLTFFQGTGKRPGQNRFSSQGL
jgi:hypothetical protein